jgi:HEAT repeat protein
MKHWETTTAVLFVVVALSTLGASGRPGTGAKAPGPESRRKASSMSASRVVERIREKDWSLVRVPGELGPESGPALLVLLREQDPEVRELAVYALHECGGAAAAKGLVTALRDPEESVRGPAASFLPGHADRHYLPELLDLLERSGDEHVRGQIARTLGVIGSSEAVIGALRRQQDSERDEAARHSIFLALARLEDPESQVAFSKLLRGPEVRLIVGALADYGYVRDRRFLPDILSLLDDPRNAKNVAPSSGVFYIRLCDVAVNTLDDVLGHPFPFTVSPIKKYTTEELDQARAILRR